MHGAWGMLRDLAPQMSLIFAMLPDGISGLTDGRSRIWLDARLDEVERRCALMHELLHVEHGHTGCQGPRAERRVRMEAARRLIAFERLLESYRWCHGPTELAEELSVTREVLADRLEGLTGRERRRLAAACMHSP